MLHPVGERVADDADVVARLEFERLGGDGLTGDENKRRSASGIRCLAWCCVCSGGLFDIAILSLRHGLCQCQGFGVALPLTAVRLHNGPIPRCDTPEGDSCRICRKAPGPTSPFLSG